MSVVFLFSIVATIFSQLLIPITSLIPATSLYAYDLPSVNLGFTSFLDGGPPAGPGIYFSQYIQSYSSEELKNQNGDNALPPVSKESLNAWIGLTQFLYQSDKELFAGGKWGLDVIVPVVMLDMDYRTNNPAFPQDDGGGMGDILVGPYLQWDPIMGKNGPIFMHRVEFQMIFPTGEYDGDKELNSGSGFFSFNPYWAGTLFITPKMTASTRLHYLWNGENDEPNRKYTDPITGLRADNTRAGQAFHANFAIDYEVIPKTMRLGINGYYLKQISDTQMSGNDVEDSREQVMGIGPGMVYHFSQNDHLFFNAYFESSAENRTEGDRFNLRWVHHF
ncbi:MAG: transporter [Desulfamplus sp.]|nr:transporter [Desulfamplus sp.]